MDFTKDDFQRLPYDINTGDFLKTYPKLATIPEFANRDEIKNFNNLFRYIVLLYSQNTPLLQISDYTERRQYAQEFSRVTKDDIANSSMFVIGYLRSCKSDKWGKLCVYRDALYNQALRLQSDQTVSGERTTALINNIELLETKIESTLASIASGDKKIESEIIGFIEEERLQDLRPENRVANILNGKPALNYDIYKKRGRGRPKRVE